MRTIEYRTIDKSAWADGPWHHEPDKRQWQDAATGLFCVIIRVDFSGNLCGYVAVPPDHPAYGLHYDGITDAEAQAKREAWREDVRRWTEAGRPPLEKWWARPDKPPPLPDDPVPGIGEKLRDIEVHGGLNYARAGQTPTVESWERLRLSVDEAKLSDEFRKFPLGDTARFVRKFQPVVDNYEAYVELIYKISICCEVEPGEPDDLWYFGFDCGHAWDISPAMDATLEMIRGERLHSIPESKYRDLAYVEEQVASLAQQLIKLYVTVEYGQAT